MGAVQHILIAEAHLRDIDPDVERRHRIDARGSPRRNIAGHKRYRAEEQSAAGECRRGR